MSKAINRQRGYARRQDLGALKQMLTIVSCLLLLAAFMAAVTSVHAAEPQENEQIKRTDGIHFALKVIGYDPAASNAITPQTELKVLGSGLPRTGTKSIKAALERLGYKVMHMEDVLALDMGPEFVYGFVSDKSLVLLVNKILSMGFNATVDSPFSGMVFKFSKLFPKAKILHSVRDTAEGWSESFLNLQVAFRFIWARPMRWIASVDWSYPAYFDAAYGFVMEFPRCDKDEMPWLQMLPWFDCYSAKTARIVPDGAGVYRAWDNKVKEAFKDKATKGEFLEFHVKQGWAPLLKFLEIKDDPSAKGVAFPHVNELSTLKAIEYTFIFLSALWPFVLLLGFGVVLWVADKVLILIRYLVRIVKK